MFENFITLSDLSNFTTCALLITVITQGVKQIKFLKNVPSQFISCVVAMILLAGFNYFSGTLNAENIFILFLNAIVMSFSSNGIYDATTSIKTELIEVNTQDGKGE